MSPRAISLTSRTTLVSPISAFRSTWHPFSGAEERLPPHGRLLDCMDFRKWPHCRVLKLSETSAGDSSLKAESLWVHFASLKTFFPLPSFARLQALVEWVCQGQVMELNLPLLRKE